MSGQLGNLKRKRVRFQEPLPPTPPPYSFAGTQWCRVSDTSGKWYGPLGREKSGQEVKSLLRVRRDMMRKARKAGKDKEVERLRKLDVFDSICGDDNGSDESETTKAGSDLSSSSETMVESYEEENEDVFLQLALGDQPDPRKCTRYHKTQVQAMEGKYAYTQCLGDKACGGFMRRRRCYVHQPPLSIISAKMQMRYFEQSPIVLQFKNDLKLIEEYRAGMYEPGSPEIEAIEQRVETACKCDIVKQFESDVAFVEAYESQIEERRSNEV